MSDLEDGPELDDDDEAAVVRLETDEDRLARKQTYAQHARVGIANKIVKASREGGPRPTPNEVLDLHKLESALAAEEEFIRLRELTREPDDEEDDE
jgi:hypothetical protein